MDYKIVYHDLVFRDDLPPIPRNWRDNILRLVHHKLTKHPQVFGKPLRSPLAGYRKLRIGSYRVIFRIEKLQIKIFVIALRKIAYQLIYQRI